MTIQNSNNFRIKHEGKIYVLLQHKNTIKIRIKEGIKE